MRRPTVPAEWSSAPRVEAPDEAGFLEALAEGLAQARDEELELRLHAWWSGNAPYRRGTSWVPFSERPPGARDNLLALVALCSPDDAMQRLYRAEALRELERFDDARAVLSGAFPEPLNLAAQLIRELATQRIAEVRELAIAAESRT